MAYLKKSNLFSCIAYRAVHLSGQVPPGMVLWLFGLLMDQQILGVGSRVKDWELPVALDVAGTKF